MASKSDLSLKIDNLDLDLGDSLRLDLDLDLSLNDEPARNDEPAAGAGVSSGDLEADFQEELDDAAKAIKAYYRQSYERKFPRQNYAFYLRLAGDEFLNGSSR